MILLALLAAAMMRSSSRSTSPAIGSTLPPLLDRRDHGGDVPQTMLPIQRDSRETFAPNQLGDDRIRQAAPTAVDDFACAQPAGERERGCGHGGYSALQ